MKFLVHRFIKDYKNVTDSYVRECYGRIASLLGIFLNICLFAGKLFAGTVFKSVSITADAINNLSDAGSSIISLVSFKLSNKPADEEHPFGHARFEYIASFIVALLVMFLSLELFKSSFDKVIHPEEISFSLLSVSVLVISILVKMWMYLYNSKYGKLIDSSVMQATAVDSLSDCISTGAVLISTLISPVVNFNLDGYMGLLVACFIFYSGMNIIKETVGDLLGQAPDEEFVKKIAQKLESYDGVLGIHDLMVHSYGPQKDFVSVHVEVDAYENIVVSHDMIDNIEKDFFDEFGIHMTIHMDPVDVRDERVCMLKEYMICLLKEIDECLTLHDFRVVFGETHNNLIFDIVVPFKFKYSDAQLIDEINKRLQKDKPNHFVVVTIDHSFTAGHH